MRVLSSPIRTPDREKSPSAISKISKPCTMLPDLCVATLCFEAAVCPVISSPLAKKRSSPRHPRLRIAYSREGAITAPPESFLLFLLSKAIFASVLTHSHRFTLPFTDHVIQIRRPLLHHSTDLRTLSLLLVSERACREDD
jgi:hypothetical protein